MASLNLPIIAPARTTVERNLCIKSLGIVVLFIFLLHIVILPFLLSTVQPNNFNISNVILVSSMLGMLYSVTGSGFSIAVAIIGSAAF